MKVSIPDSNFYKVCYGFLDGYYSKVVKYYRYGVKYQLNEWTFPKIGQLFVFKEYRDAFLYAGNDPSAAIFSCKIMNPIICHTTASLRYVNLDNIIYEYWNKETYDRIPTPFGTYLCDGVKLIERIK